MISKKSNSFFGKKQNYFSLFAMRYPVVGLAVKKKEVATYQNSVHGGLYVSEIVLIGVWTVAKNTE
jgi:hypothetical protein